MSITLIYKNSVLMNNVTETSHLFCPQMRNIFYLCNANGTRINIEVCL